MDLAGPGRLASSSTPQLPRLSLGVKPPASKSPCGDPWCHTAGKILCNLASALRTEGIIIMLCSFIFNLREILAATSCQGMLSCHLCSTGKSGLRREPHGAPVSLFGERGRLRGRPSHRRDPSLALSHVHLPVCSQWRPFPKSGNKAVFVQGSCLPHLPHLLSGSAWVWASAYHTASLQT